MLPYVTLNLLSLRDITLEHMTFKVSLSGLLYLNEKVFFLNVGSMIVVAKSLIFLALNHEVLRALFIW